MNRNCGARTAPCFGARWPAAPSTRRGRRTAASGFIPTSPHGIWRSKSCSIMAALDQAESANRAKGTFLSNMSHELRTPLNAVIGFSRLMARAGSLSDEQRRNLEIINRAGNHLLTLINDVLTLSKIDAGHLQLNEEDVNPRQLLNDIVELLLPHAGQAGLALTLETDGLPAAVRVDAIKLRQVLLNLISNAIKFTTQGGVRVLARAVADGAANATATIAFEVLDSGIGSRS